MLANNIGVSGDYIVLEPKTDVDIYYWELDLVSFLLFVLGEAAS